MAMDGQGGGMSLRVLKSDSQGRWKDGQPSWDLLQQRKKQPRSQAPSQEQAPSGDRPGVALYNSKGDLVTTACSLEIDV